MGRTVTVAARPGGCLLDLDTWGVIVVDMQNDFGSEGGMFHRAGIDIAPIAALAEPIATVLDAARRLGRPVIYLKMAFQPDLSDAGHPTSPTWQKHVPLHAGDDVVAPDGSASRILIRDTWNTDIVDGLTPVAGDIVVYKHRYSGFYGTELESIVDDLGLELLVVVGATTSVCVESTVRDAVFRDLHCLVLDDCTAEPIAHDAPRSNHAATLLTLELLFADVTDSAALLDALARATASPGS